MNTYVKVYTWENLCENARRNFKKSKAAQEILESYIYDYIYDKKYDVKKTLANYGILNAKIYYNFNSSRSIYVTSDFDLNKFLEMFPEIREIILNDSSLSEDEKESFFNNFCCNFISPRRGNTCSIDWEAYYHTGESTEEFVKAINEKIAELLLENSKELHDIEMNTTIDNILTGDEYYFFTENGIFIGNSDEDCIIFTEENL